MNILNKQFLTVSRKKCVCPSWWLDAREPRLKYRTFYRETLDLKRHQYVNVEYYTLKTDNRYKRQ